MTPQQVRELSLRLLAGHKALLRPPYGRMNAQDRLFHACLCAYAKHVQQTPHIGWNELGDILHNAICEAIGDDAYVDWSERIKEESNQSDVED